MLYIFSFSESQNYIGVAIWNMDLQHLNVFIVWWTMLWVFASVTTETLDDLWQIVSSYILVARSRLLYKLVTHGRWYAVFSHDDVIKWKHFPRYWLFVRGIHRSPVNSPHKGQWRGALVFPLICARINGWVNNGDAGDLRHHRAHYDVIKSSGILRIMWTRHTQHSALIVYQFYKSDSNSN